MPNFPLLLCSVFASSFTTLIFFLSSFMASPSSNKKTNDAYRILPASSVKEKPPSRRTIYIETDVSNFKAVVQKFTALPEENPPAVYPHPVAGKPPSRDMGARRPGLKLHERRRSVCVPEIKVNNNGRLLDCGGKSGSSSSSSSSSSSTYSSSSSSSSSSSGSSARPRRVFGFSLDQVTVSPMENLACGNTKAPQRITCSAPLNEEMQGIDEKDYYLLPTSSDTPGGSKPPPLLPLFPIHPSYPNSLDIDAVENEDPASSA